MFNCNQIGIARVKLGGMEIKSHFHTSWILVCSVLPKEWKSPTLLKKWQWAETCYLA